MEAHSDARAADMVPGIDLENPQSPQALCLEGCLGSAGSCTSPVPTAIAAAVDPAAATDWVGWDGSTAAATDGAMSTSAAIGCTGSPTVATA